MALRDTPQMTRWDENSKLLSLKEGNFYGSFWAQFPYRRRKYYRTVHSRGALGDAPTSGNEDTQAHWKGGRAHNKTAGKHASVRQSQDPGTMSSCK